MPAITTLAQLEQAAKDVFGEVSDVRPDHAKFASTIPFQQSDKLGADYVIMVPLTRGQGVTYAGPEEDGFTLRPAKATISKGARVRGSQIVQRDQVGLKLAAQAASKGKASFVNVMGFLMEDQLVNANQRLEIVTLYGQSGLGQATSSVNISATSTTLQLNPQTFAPGIWNVAQGADLEIYDESGPTLIASVELVKISDINTAKIRVSGLAGQITALDAALPGDLRIHFAGARGKEALGLDKIITTSGTLFDIDNTSFDLFKGQEFDCGAAPLSFQKLTKALVNSMHYGAEGKLVCWVAPRTWQDLMKDEASLRQYDASYNREKAVKGNAQLEFLLLDMVVQVRAHSMIKEGEGFIVPEGSLKRVGAYELSVRNPADGSKMFRLLEDVHAVEWRIYTDQALFADKPARLTKLFNIVNS